MDAFWSRRFTADGKARAQAEREYQACSELRDELFLKFRKHATDEVDALVGSSQFLMDCYNSEFLALSEDGRHVVCGDFGDTFVPELDLLDIYSPSVSTRDISSAVQRFQNRLREKNAIPSDRISAASPYEAALRTDGYRVKRYSTNSIRDLRIDHNDEPLSSTYSAAPKALLDSIVRAPTPDPNCTASVTLIVWLDGSSDGERDAYLFRLSYLDDRGRSDEELREHRLSLCRRIVPFVSRLTSHMGDGRLNDHRMAEDDIAF